MKERPILFSGPMVRAILDGRKTVTRRVVKWPCRSECDGVMRVFSDRETDAMNKLLAERRLHPHQRGFCPYGQPGDRLWVRETCYIEPGAKEALESGSTDDDWIVYKADQPCFSGNVEGEVLWRSSIHMPRWASRITLEVVSVRVERLQDIGKDGRKAADVLAEGITREQIQRMQFENFFHHDDLPAMAFGSLWESINGKGSWAANPWVWRVEFRRIKP